LTNSKLLLFYQPKSTQRNPKEVAAPALAVRVPGQEEYYFKKMKNLILRANIRMPSQEEIILKK